MPDLQDRIYCSEQIHIPPTFPYIMKLYCKAAIRTQPYDLLKWSAAYFRALANGEEPPVKERVEYPPYDSPSGLTPGFIKVLINQFGKDPLTTLPAQVLFRKWSDICLDEYLLIKLIALLGARTSINWVNFVGICAGFISKSLTQTMVLICELFTEEAEGGMATIPYGLFIDLYIFLAGMECGPLTPEEDQEQEALMAEPDVCLVFDKIKRGEYEGEMPGEYLYEEGEGGGRELPGEEQRGEFGEGSSEEGAAKKEEPAKEEVMLPKKEDSLGDEFEERPGKKKEAEDSKEELGEEEESYEETPDTSQRDAGSLTTMESVQDASQLASVALGESAQTSQKGISAVSVKEPGKQEAAEEEKEEEEPDKADKADKAERPHKMKLEELEPSLREKIEARLQEEEESYLGEEEREFEELGDYLLGAAARVHKFTAETLGYNIFRKYMRQEVPGIGPVVDADQVEQVVSFMDTWAHKQELMVMPRNIRHWMCPPLDKVPTPQP